MTEKIPKGITRRKILAVIVIVLAAAAVINIALKFSGFYRRVTHPVLYQEYIELYSDKYSVPPEIICAVINTESSFDSEAESHAGAMGLMQITKETFWWLLSKSGESIPDEKLFDPQVNIRYGTYFLSILYDEFGSWDTAFAAYNAGRSRVIGWLGDPDVSEDGKLVNIPIEETREYVKRVNSGIKIYREIYEEIY